MLFFNLSVTGQSLPSGSRSTAMGRCSVAISDLWSTTNNPAGIAQFEKPMIGIFYEHRFMLSELSNKSIAAVIPTKFGVFGSAYNHTGYNLFNRQRIELVYSRFLGKHLSIGVQLNYIITSLGNNYGKKDNITFNVGLQSDVSEKVTLGAWIANPVGVKLADFNDETLPIVFRFGSLYKVNNFLDIVCEIEKNTLILPLIVRCGIEYTINNRYFFRTGTSTNKEIFTFGVGITLKNFNMNISATMHDILGFSQQIGLNYSF